MKESESQLQRRILDALTDAGYWIQRLQSGTVKINGGWMTLAAPGTPDILVMAPVFGFLEVKLPGESLNEKQVAWHEKAKELGVRAVVVSSPADAIGAVRSWR